MRGGRNSGGRGSRSKRSRNDQEVTDREARLRARTAAAEERSSKRDTIIEFLIKWRQKSSKLCTRAEGWNFDEAE